MPESIDLEPLASTEGEPDGSLTRRSMLTGAVVAGAGLVAPQALAAPGRQQSDRGHLDMPRSLVKVQPDRLSLKVDNTVAPPRAGEAVPLLISTRSSTPTTLKVAGETGNTTVGLHREDPGLARSVEVRVAADKPVTVWVVPHKIGPHSQPGDWLTISDGHDSVRVEVWIEPIGGSWTTVSPQGTQLDLGIVAIHAALVRGRGGPEVVMYSLPRKRDSHGNFVPNPDYKPGSKKDPWIWDLDVEGMEYTESMTLDLSRWETRDLNPWNKPGRMKHNLFCSGASHLPDGRLLVAGGHVHAHAHVPHTKNGKILHCYDPKLDRWVTLPATMKEVRWYPTVTPLPDGRMLIVSGSGEGLWFSDKEYFVSINNNYVVYDGNNLSEQKKFIANASGKPGSVYPPLATYPAVFVLPDAGSGTVIATVETNRAWLHTYRTTAQNSGEALIQQGVARPMTRPGSRSYPWYGSAVLLPLHHDKTIRKILVVGGTEDASQTYTRVVGENQPEVAEESAARGTARSAQLLELDVAQPLDKTGTWKHLTTRCARFLCDATLLADGTVLVSGGAAKGWTNNNSGPVNAAEIYDPDSDPDKGKFRLAATSSVERRYHAVALLLPDGTVLKAGSTGGFGGPNPKQVQEWFSSRTDAEIYQPSYLWRGPRPSIDKVVAPAPAGVITLTHGQQFHIRATGPTLDGRAKAALIRLGATTHGNNMEQRYVWLDAHCHSADPGKYIVNAKAPANKAAAPPGDYMLVLVDGNGVPSEATLVHVSNQTH